MDDHELVELGERLENAFNTSDWDAYSALLADDAVLDNPRIRARGHADIMQFVRGVKETFPDLRATATSILACGNVLVREITWQGTHAGPLRTAQATIPPTNRPVTFKGAMLVEVSGHGKVVSIREYYDRAAVLAQLGVGASAPTSTA